MTPFAVDTDPFQLALVLIASVIGGAVNAIAGGGTLLTFPALVGLGIPALVANATSTVALWPGTVASIWGYRDLLVGMQSWVKWFAIPSVLGGLVGAVLLLETPASRFDIIVPWLVFGATVLFVIQKPLAERIARRDNAHRSPEAADDHTADRAVSPSIKLLVYQFGVAVYGGYFGAGIGILMLASLGCLGLTDIHEMNAVKTVLSSIINQVAAAYFIFAGLIDWPKALVMTTGALAGYFLGAHYSQRFPQRRVRQIITGIGLLISAVMFYKQFG